MRRRSRYEDDWDGEDDWDDGDRWDDGDDEGRRNWPVVLLVAVMLGAIAVGSLLLAKSDRDTGGGVALPTTSTASAESTSLATASSATASVTASSASATASASAPTRTPTPTTTATATATSVAADPPGELVALQTVPAVRDVIVAINGHNVASDGTGLIPLAQDQRHGTIEFVGLVSTPALMQVQLVAWSDGQTTSARSLDTLPGPVAQIGLVVSTRVQVTLDDPSLAGDQVEFSSEAGPVDVPLGTVHWLPARRAIEATDGFVEQTLTYVSEWTIDDHGRTTRLAYEEFHARPEVKWVVKPG